MFDQIDYLTRSAPLLPELVPYIRRVSFGEMIHHPMVITPLSMGREHAAVVNGLFEQKMEQHAAAIDAHDFDRLVMLYERPYRFDGLQRAIVEGLAAGTPEYWRIVGRVWTDSENIHENFDGWREVWGGDAQARHYAMSVEDRRVFSGLRKRFHVYRGFDYRGTKLGFSWTTSRKKAIWFANRFATTPSDTAQVVTTTVEKDHVLAYFGGRNEAEIVIDPDMVGKWSYVEI